MVTTSMTNAINAYSNAAQAFAAKPSETSSSSEEDNDVSDFASLLRDGAKTAIETGKKSEELSKQAIAGKADIRDVVSAVNNAQLTLETVVSVRDKVISAYNDILRMNI